METKKLRSVLFRVWIPAHYQPVEGAPDQPEIIPGTNEWSDFVKPGSFHCWGQSYFYERDQIVQHTVAIIEDRNGFVYELTSDKFKFAV
jgi:hypothetical protein